MYGSKSVVQCISMWRDSEVYVTGARSECELVVGNLVLRERRRQSIRKTTGQQDGHLAMVLEINRLPAAIPMSAVMLGNVCAMLNAPLRL